MSPVELKIVLGIGRKSRVRKNATLVALAAVLTLSSCGTVGASSPTPLAPENTQSVSPEEAKSLFMEISKASCEKAMAEGVVEKSISPEGFTLVLVPKEQAYLDYSAAYFQPEDTFALIWEADALSSCGASINFDLAEEVGVESDIAVTYYSTNETFETTQDLGEFGISHLRYTISDGLISEVETLGSSETNPRTISYGNLQESDWNILRTAVDRFLEGQ
jgi:hypothetical protein